MRFFKNLSITFLSKNKSATLIIGALLILTLSGFFWEKKEESCKSLVDMVIKKRYIGEAADKILAVCNQKVRTGDYEELYAYYRIYKAVDKSFQDKMPANKYHWMLFYANENSREFDSKTQEFKKPQGLYGQELKDFEEQMTQEEKIKSFAYIADNLAVGKEGWVLKNDYQKSFEYLKRAAEAGDYGSQINLGSSYFSGTDWMNKFIIEKNYIDAYKWIYLATLHSEQKSYPHNRTIDGLKILAKNFNMTQNQIHQAKAQAKIWLDQNQEFIKNHPLKIIKMTDEEVKLGKEETNKFIKDYQLDKPLSKNQDHPLPINKQ
jgi:hypothetical protein